MPRVLLIVMDSVGVGELPDAADYGDAGSNTLANMAAATGGLKLPCLQSLGLGNIGEFKGIDKNSAPLASYGRMRELSKGKDTVTGHWEMMGIIGERPFPTYPHGFPDEIIGEFKRRIGRGILGNKAASGTEIIMELGEEHIKTGFPIVYTSADSVFQIAAHEDVIPPEDLYGICRVARGLLMEPPHNVCRVIARPFIGPPFTRTPRRRDFALLPPEDTALDALRAIGVPVVSVGKVSDMFAGRGFSDTIKTAGNTDSYGKLDGLLGEGGGAFREGLLFCNLVDFDTLYGHRNDPAGYAAALGEFDRWLCKTLPRIGEGDYLIITADHGCDPTTSSTDHSREYVPVLLYHKGHAPRDLGTREGFIDIGATLAEVFGAKDFKRGKSLI